jgi:flavodoxin I
MKALVVYDSFFGNTERIARSVASALGTEPDVAARRAGDVDPSALGGLDLLVVGSPTRAFSPSPAVKAFLKRIPSRELQGVKVAAFDTRITAEDSGSAILSFMIKLFGYAANPILRRLASKGGQAIEPPKGFYVAGPKGPLKDGELERASEWACEMAKQL